MVGVIRGFLYLAESLKTGILISGSIGKTTEIYIHVGKRVLATPNPLDRGVEAMADRLDAQAQIERQAASVLPRLDDERHDSLTQ